MTAHKLDAGRLVAEGDRAYALAEVENDREMPRTFEDVSHADCLVALWTLLPRGPRGGTFGGA